MSFNLGAAFGWLTTHAADPKVQTDVPALVQGFESVIGTVAHGEGGPQKLIALLTALAALTNSASKTLSDVTAARPVVQA